MGWRFEPIALLLGAGAAIGLMFPLGKLAANAGVAPLAYAAWSALGASALLAALGFLWRQPLPLDRLSLRYAAIAGALSFAIPFGVLVFTIPRLGSGIPAIFQSLAPILTLAIVTLLRLEPPRLTRVLGLVLGLVGVLVILAAREGEAETTAPLAWYFLAIATPLVLAAGNVYRTTYWPRERSALSLATLSMMLAAAWLFALIGLVGQADLAIAALGGHWLLLVAQSIAFGIGYALFFRLQQVGGPVYLSQISYVNTGVGVLFAVALFGEPLSAWTWAALALILAGLALVNRADGEGDLN